MDLTLISIVVGLGLTELLLAFSQLVRARRRVSWDPLPLAWALVVLFAAVNFWWGIRALMSQASDWLTGTFMLAMISPVFLFLASAAALPRIEPGERLDMKAAYAEQRAAFLLFLLGYQCGNWILDFAVRGGPPPMIVAISRSVAGLALIVALLVRSRRLDWAALAVIAGAYGLRLVTQVAR